MSTAPPPAPKPAAPQKPTAASGEGLPKVYKPVEHEGRIRDKWERSGAFHAEPIRTQEGATTPGPAKRPYSIVIPPPNVTAALHLGHALNNTIQDILIRAHRMMGYETLWMPGTDHAGIATQTVVEKRVQREEGKRRTDFSRDEFVAKIQAFKDEYEATITEQLKAMGCSCDWARQRFTMDEQCAAAVREAFFRLFRDGLIYRGKRLVNWDPVTQTALADDEVEMEEVDGAFYYLRYPLVHPPAPGEDAQPVTWGELALRGFPGAETQPTENQAWVTVATTRPETYLGDTAVAVNPNDRRAVPLRGLMVELPIVGRLIPIVEDDYVVMPALDPDMEGVDPKAKFATGFLKVTPAHDENDYLIGQRHNLPIINVMAPDASISDKHGWTDVGDAHIFVGKSREQARKEVVQAFDMRGLLEGVKPYRHTVGHSYRSHAPIEPYYTDQWYVKVTDDRLAGAALRAMAPDQRTGAAKGSPDRKAGDGRPPAAGDGDGGLRFYPARYAKTYETWHENIRDWCISRQLWWGHRIPVWSKDIGSLDAWTGTPGSAQDILSQRIADATAASDVSAAFVSASDPSRLLSREEADGCSDLRVLICVRSKEARFESPLDAKTIEEVLVEHGFVQDPDVLDTWFSSALWPISTMGWPDPDKFPATKGLLEAFNPTNVLCTAREIITLWVSRMVMFNRYFRGQDLGMGAGNGPLPFRDVFIHAMIQDGEGRKMSKTLGNGVDPLDIIATHGADAMRFTLCHMTTQTQDVRMPVVKDPATGKNTSPKFDLGRNFANKLWNAARFAIGILEKAAPADASPGAGSASPAALSLADRWMLSRLSAAVREAETALKEYQFSDYATILYDLLWRDFCDWYLEAIKPTVNAEGSAHQRAVLRATLDVILRLLHPVMPFVTEAIFEHLRTLPAHRVPGIDLATADLLCTSSWPQVAANLRDTQAEQRFERLRSLITAVREVRAQHNVAPKDKLNLHAPAALIGEIGDDAILVQTLAGIDRLTTDAPVAPAVILRFEDTDLHLTGFKTADVSAERERLNKIIADESKKAATLEARLSNPGYTEKAPAKLVEESRAQLAKCLAAIEAARRDLERLG